MEDTNSIVYITGYASDGRGVARLGDGRVAFVRGAARGDRCRIKIINEKKHYGDAAVECLIEPSAGRIEPDCPHCGECGGCAWRHVNYAEELFAKRERVKDALRRLGGVDVEPEPNVLTACGANAEPKPDVLTACGAYAEQGQSVLTACNAYAEQEPDVLAAGGILRYRNKAQFSLALRDDKAVAGFYEPRSHKLVEIDDCLLIGADAVKAVRLICGWIDRRRIALYDPAAKAGLIRRVYMRTGRDGLTVCISVNGGDSAEMLKAIDDLKSQCDYFKSECEKLSGVLVMSGDGGIFDDVDLPGGEFFTVWGSGDLTDYYGDLAFRVSPASFNQVNPAAAKLLLDKAAEYADLGAGDFLLDLYCGTGTMALYLGRNAKKSLGVEFSEAAIKDAKHNAKRNNIANASFICKDVSLLDTRGLFPDCVVVDPPRKGLSRAAVGKVAEMSPRRVVYVSCEPSTMARDVRLLDGYRLQKACVVDMFPRTSGIECVALLTRR